MEKFKRITEDNFESFTMGNYDEWLTRRVQTFLIGDSADFQSCLEESLIDCESPIEQLLAIELEELGLERMCKFNPFIDVIAIEKQQEIQGNSKKYRVDFLIPVFYKNQGGKMFVIECDGYEFHQKTKKQVEEDNKRHRELQRLGYEIIRFSGTEIYHKPHDCALEVKNIILSKCEYRQNGKS